MTTYYFLACLLFFVCLPAQAQNIKPDSIYQTNQIDEIPVFTYQYKNSRNSPNLAFGYYFMNNLRYPQEAKRFGVEGWSVVKFIVEKDGSVSHVALLYSIGGPDRDYCSSCDEEALRLIREMPKWEAGKKNGQSVRTQMHHRVRFKLED